METWYKISDYSNDIETVAITKSTSKTVTLPKSKWGRERREALISSGTRYFPTEEKALVYLLHREVSACASLEDRLEDCRSCIDRARKRLNEIQTVPPFCDASSSEGRE